MPPEQRHLTEQEAHERAVAVRLEELRAAMYDAMQLWAATAEIMLMPWLQSPTDLLNFCAYRRRFGFPEPERAPTQAELERLAEDARCRFCANL